MLQRLLPLVLLALVIPGAASAAPKKVSCKSGKTLFTGEGARIFQTARPYSGGTLHKLYLCSRTVKHPLLWDDDYAVDAIYEGWHATGRYVAYIFDWEDGVEAGWDAGVVDLATGEDRLQAVTPDTPIDRGNPKAVAADRDGSLAFLETTVDDKPVIGWVPNGVYKLGAAVMLTKPTEAVDPKSLAFNDGLITWTTVSGTPGSIRAR